MHALTQERVAAQKDLPSVTYKVSRFVDIFECKQIRFPQQNIHLTD